jgi:hypothetical protein
MSWFRPKLTTRTLATVLMQYAVTGDLAGGEESRFALGPSGIAAADGCDVLPEKEVRTRWDQLSARDSFIIALETIYLRAFVGAASVEAFITKKALRESTLAHIKAFWREWSKDAPLDYEDSFETVFKIYGVFVALRGFSDDEIKESVGRQFSDACDPFHILGSPLREELARRGATIFSESAERLTQLLESTLHKYRIVTS